MMSGRLVTVLALTVALALAGAGCGAHGDAPPSSFTTRQADTKASSAPSPAEWLGLNYNSSTGIGGVGDFASRGVVYDRGGPLEPVAGKVAARGTTLGDGLRVSLAAGMVPDVVVGEAVGPHGCATNPNATTLCLPTRGADIAAYVRGFIATATSVRRVAGSRRVIFEPMNEPWDWGSPPGTPSGRRAAAEYAAVLRRLLPAARAAGIPLRDIYVAGDGIEMDGTSWIADVYAAEPCLGPGPRTCGPIEGWNLHPYGLPGLRSQGIETVPATRAQMVSGRNNVIVSEIGFCSLDAWGGKDCNQNSPSIVGSDHQTSAWLRETLAAASVMHRQGWLKAVIVWDRGGDAWGMQNPNGTLTAEGAVLARFARAPAG